MESKKREREETKAAETAEKLKSKEREAARKRNMQELKENAKKARKAVGRVKQGKTSAADCHSTPAGLKCGLCETRVLFDHITCIVCQTSSHRYCINVDPFETAVVCPLCKLL